MSLPHMLVRTPVLHTLPAGEAEPYCLLSHSMEDGDRYLAGLQWMPALLGPGAGLFMSQQAGQLHLQLPRAAAEGADARC